MKSAHPFLARSKNNLTSKNIALSENVRLLCSRVHEVTGQSADGFVASVVKRTNGHVIWIGRDNDVYSLCPQALQSFFCPSRLITVEGISRKEILWAAEQALRCQGASAVVVELARGPNLNESRRLQIAAEQGKTLGLIKITKGAQSSAAQTRWQCTPINKTHLSAANDQVWQWQMTKNKNGQTGCWNVKWRQGTNGTGDVHMVCAASA